MSDLIFETCDYRRSLFEGLLEARRVHGGKHLIVEDTDRNPLSYNQLLLVLAGAGALSRPETLRKDSPVGVLLPNSLGGAVTFFALQAYGRTPAMLDFSTGIKEHAVGTGRPHRVETVLTSRKFIKLAELDDVAAAPSTEKAKLVYLEDVRDEKHARRQDRPGSSSASSPACGLPPTRRRRLPQPCRPFHQRFRGHAKRRRPQPRKRHGQPLSARRQS